jgi:hypothetical protein
MWQGLNRLFQVNNVVESFRCLPTGELRAGSSSAYHRPGQRDLPKWICVRCLRSQPSEHLESPGCCVVLPNKMQADFYGAGNYGGNILANGGIVLEREDGDGKV